MKNVVITSFIIIFSILYGCSSQAGDLVPVFEVSGITDEDIVDKYFNYSRTLIAGDHVFAIGNNDVTVFKIDNNQEVINRFGVNGFGPGEFKSINTLNFDGRYLYVYDRILKKVAVLSLDLELVDEFIIEESIFSINFSQSDIAYATEFSMNRWSLISYDKSSFRNPEYLYSTSTRRADIGIGLIHASEPYLLINHIFTNTSTTYHLETGALATIRYNYLADRPEMINAGIYDAPRGPVWFGAIFKDNQIFQLAPYDGSINFIASDLKGNMQYRVILNNDIDIARFSSQGVVGMKDDSIYYYSLESLIQDGFLTKR